MTRINFTSYHSSVSAVFTCTNCEKPKRKRTFRVECTVNPFNKNEDGTIKTPYEVRAQSKEAVEKKRAEFLNEPWCATCENQLSYTARRELSARRKAGRDGV